MDTLNTRSLTSELADDLGWLEQHAPAAWQRSGRQHVEVSGGPGSQLPGAFP